MTLENSGDENSTECTTVKTKNQWIANDDCFYWQECNYQVSASHD